MATGAAGADGIFRGIFDGCISGHDTGIQRRPYHKNCTCELHKSKGNCSHSSRCANISYKIRRSWSESCLSLVASSSAGSSCHSSTSSSPATGGLDVCGKKNLVRSNTGSGYEESCLALTANISTASYSGHSLTYAGGRKNLVDSSTGGDYDDA
ncbi:putative homeobox protein knotted-1-like 3-like [Capsicum annuum]|nr:putative homeobox protein knotted-1-like 3-like [Capsicum annuum]